MTKWKRTSARNLFHGHCVEEFVIEEDHLQDIGAEALEPGAGAIIILRQKTLDEEQEDLQVAIDVVRIVI